MRELAEVSRRDLRDGSPEVGLELSDPGTSLLPDPVGGALQEPVGNGLG
jgi:hypothetical protein